MDSPTTSVVDVLTISAAVVALVQLLKWKLLPDEWGPVAVMIFAAAGVALWGYSKGPSWDRALMWEYFVGWINVSLAAAGIFGFTRASAATVTKMTPPPPSGAGSDPVVKE